jgi:hypothetical protein
MTTGEYAPLLRSGSSRTNGMQHHHEIQAHYFDITDMDAWPIAGLLVLLDGRSQPVRAELHLYDGMSEAVHEVALRQARMVLQERYIGGDPVPLRILETLQLREPLQVRLPPLGARPQASRFEVNRTYLVAGAALAAMVLIIWLVTIFTQPAAEEPSAEAGSTPVATASVEALGEAVAAQDGAATDGAVPIESDLPPSRNARPDLGIGLRVTVLPPLQAAVRTEAGANAGDVIGLLGSGMDGTIIGGPALRRGDTDTIVWWLVELDDGTQGWSPANTSTQTLMLPAQE